MTDFKVRWFTWVAIVGLLLWWPLGVTLPDWWGWENGPIENFQLAFLFLGIFASWKVSRRFPEDKHWRHWWYCSMATWILILGRELSWGRTFFRVSPDGVSPLYIAKDDLSYGFLINPVVGVLIVAVVVGLVWNFRWKKARRNLRIPFWDAAIFVFVTLGFNLAERGFLPVTSPDGMVLEELGETVAYWCLFSVVYFNSKPFEGSDDDKPPAAKKNPPFPRRREPSA